MPSVSSLSSSSKALSCSSFFTSSFLLFTVVQVESVLTFFFGFLLSSSVIMLVYVRSMCIELTVDAIWSNRLSTFGGSRLLGSLGRSLWLIIFRDSGDLCRLAFARLVGSLCSSIANIGIAPIGSSSSLAQFLVLLPFCESS